LCISWTNKRLGKTKYSRYPHGNHVTELSDTVSKQQVTKGRRGLYLQVTSAL